MNFKKEEIEQLTQIIKEYNQFHIEIEKLSDEIEKLGQHRERIFENIKDLKKKENEFLNDMMHKYGREAVSPYNLLQIVKEYELNGVV